MANKDELALEYLERFGEEPDGLTVKELKAALKGSIDIDDASPAKSSGGAIYWRNPIHIHEIGPCHGLVTPEAKKAFEKMAKETGSGAKLSDWVTDVDLEAERLKSAKAKMRRQIGLDTKE